MFVKYNYNYIIIKIIICIYLEYLYKIYRNYLKKKKCFFNDNFTIYYLYFLEYI